MTFGGRVKMQMAARGIRNPAELARRMSLPRQTISKWLNNETKDLELSNLYKLADILDCNARWLALRDGVPQKPVEMDLEKKRVIDLYQALPKAVRASWVSSGEALLVGSTSPSVAQPFKQKA
jgi:transcriptional regulator with XRE-family HTH domain